MREGGGNSVHGIVFVSHGMKHDAWISLCVARLQYHIADGINGTFTSEEHQPTLMKAMVPK